MKWQSGKVVLTYNFRKINRQMFVRSFYILARKLDTWLYIICFSLKNKRRI